jgi:hypothetical protein
MRNGTIMDFVDLIEEMGQKLGLITKEADDGVLFYIDQKDKKVIAIVYIEDQMVVISPRWGEGNTRRINIIDPNFIQKFETRIKSLIKKRLERYKNAIFDVESDIYKKQEEFLDLRSELKKFKKSVKHMEKILEKKI